MTGAMENMGILPSGHFCGTVGAPVGYGLTEGVGQFYCPAPASVQAIKVEREHKAWHLPTPPLQRDFSAAFSVFGGVLELDPLYSNCPLTCSFCAPGQTNVFRVSWYYPTLL